MLVCACGVLRGGKMGPAYVPTLWYLRATISVLLYRSQVSLCSLWHHLVTVKHKAMLAV